MSTDGLIIFISRAYGGRINDVELFKISGIMNVLPKNSEIMADRVLKNIDNILQKQNIKLSRPLSVLASRKQSKEEAILTKKIASLRIHIERLIKRCREFDFFKPLATVNHCDVSHFNPVLKIASGLINLQYPIITK